MLYHIVPGNLSAHFLLGEGVILVKTLRQRNPHVERYKDNDLRRRNTEGYSAGRFFDLGVIHIINGVLIPPSLHGAVLYGTS